MFKKKQKDDSNVDIINHVKVNGIVSKNSSYTDSENSDMARFEPRNYEEVRYVAEHLMAGQPCLVVLHRLETQEVRRFTDFLCGVVFTLKGKVIKQETKSYLYVPRKQ